MIRQRLQFLAYLIATQRVVGAISFGDVDRVFGDNDRTPDDR